MSTPLNPQAASYVPLTYYSDSPLLLPPGEIIYYAPPPPPPPTSATPYFSLHAEYLHSTHFTVHPPPQPETLVALQHVAEERRQFRGGCCGESEPSAARINRERQPQRRQERQRRRQQQQRRRGSNNVLGWRVRNHGNGDEGKRESGSGSTTPTSRVWLNRYEVLPLEASEGKTTVMIKNIPKEYTRGLLVEFLDEHCMLMNQVAEDDDTVSAFDFVYLPIDFRTGRNKGYAFVNFTSTRGVWRFYEACNNRRWDLFQSPKIREIVTAIIQGKEAQVRHFSKSMFQCESNDFLPVYFSPPRNGSGEQVRETTVGTRVRPILVHRI